MLRHILLQEIFSRSERQSFVNRDMRNRKVEQSDGGFPATIFNPGIIYTRNFAIDHGNANFV